MVVRSTLKPFAPAQSPNRSSMTASANSSTLPQPSQMAKAISPLRWQCSSAQATKAFREAGARVEEVKTGWPSPRNAWYTIFCGGIATRLEGFLDRKSEIDAGLLRIVDWYRSQPPSAYVQAWFDRLIWWQHPRALFDTYDLLLTPTIACPPFAVNLDNPAQIAGKAVPPYGWIPFTYPFNLTGQPAASVPCGFTKSKLPIGLQIVGRRFDDATVLRASAAFERARPWADKRPPLT